MELQMEKKEDFNFSIIFTSLEDYAKNNEYKEIFNTINETNLIMEQQQLFNFSNDELLAPISFTRS